MKTREEKKWEVVYMPNDVHQDLPTFDTKEEAYAFIDGLNWFCKISPNEHPCDSCVAEYSVFENERFLSSPEKKKEVEVLQSLVDRGLTTKEVAKDILIHNKKDRLLGLEVELKALNRVQRRWKRDSYLGLESALFNERYLLRKAIKKAKADITSILVDDYEREMNK